MACPKSIARALNLSNTRVTFGPMFQRHLYEKFADTLLPAIAADHNPFAL